MTIRNDIRLTELASCAGCAAKMAPGTLAQVVGPLAAWTHPDLLVGLQTSDDAAVFRIDANRAIVQTIDFFPPVVDNPRDYGRIAAANSMSDIFAMGGQVVLALNVTAWPADADPSMLSEILAGAAETVSLAGGVIAGGHTVIDTEPKFGLSVTGFLDPARILTKGGVLPGDLLYLTKPLGVGVITTAARNGVAEADSLAAAVSSMTTLNLDASKAALSARAHACTDVTGYGLMGHAHEMAERSDVRLTINTDRLPWLPGVRTYLEAGQTPGGYHRNRDYYAATVPGATVDEALDATTAALIYNPETSGGLLIAISPERCDEFEQACAELGAPQWLIGAAQRGKGVVATH